ncbi:MAG: endonuclease/exonuclease/phosphatase family protein [Planctomycetota bacterium]
MFRLLNRVTLGVSVLLGVALTALPAAADTITIGAYNVENFFDVFDDPYTGDEGVRVKSRADVQTMAKALKKLDADVVMFQELENEHLLQAMIDEFLPNAGYRYVAAQRTNSGRGINLGVISRYPIMELRSYRFKTLTHPDAPGRTWRFARDLMRVTIDAGLDRPIEVFSVHLKSNRDGPDDPNSRLYRTAEAIALKNIAREEVAKDPGFLGVFAGDFNSNYETRPEQPRPWPAMAHLLESESEPGEPPLLTDVHADLSDRERITLPGSGRYPPVTFDYILVTPAMAERYVEGSATVINSRSLTSGSDHFPIGASFRLD